MREESEKSVRESDFLSVKKNAKKGQKHVLRTILVFTQKKKKPENPGHETLPMGHQSVEFQNSSKTSLWDGSQLEMAHFRCPI